jgi:hypothetical protein
LFEKPFAISFRTVDLAAGEVAVPDALGHARGDGGRDAPPSLVHGAHRGQDLVGGDVLQQVAARARAQGLVHGLVTLVES